ncbi:MAG TPA: glutathione S-transferase family protein [Kofleriaceae bacterium]
MALTLYIGNKRFSSWSLRPYVALVHAGAEFETKIIQLRREESRARISAVSPSGRVPVLYDDDLVVFDSLAICEYVAELYPAAGLWPDDRATRARARSVAAEMHSGFPALRNEMSMDLAADLPHRGRTSESLADIVRVQEVWSTTLATSGGPYLFGAFTIADAMYAPVVTRFKTYGVELSPINQRYCDKMLAMPAMKQWYADAVTEPDLT